MRTINSTARLMGLLAGLSVAATACGGATGDRPGSERVTEPGELTMAAALNGQRATPLLVDYAAAGLTVCDSDHHTGTLVLFGAFADGRVTRNLDLATISMSIDLAEVPVEDGAVDFMLDADQVALYLESSTWDNSELLATNDLRGRLHLRYDSPPRPGISIQGAFSLVIENLELHASEEPSQLDLEGAFEVPVVRSCS